jgi:hypothetical protein
MNLNALTSRTPKNPKAVRASRTPKSKKVMSWVADPLFNLMLRLNRYGKHILKRDQIWPPT